MVYCDHCTIPFFEEFRQIAAARLIRHKSLLLPLVVDWRVMLQVSPHCVTSYDKVHPFFEHFHYEILVNWGNLAVPGS